MDATTLPARQKALTLVGALLGLLMAALDQTIVATAGPAVQAELHIEPALYTWLTTSYLVASAVMTPVWGKLSDQFGRRRILLQGITIFLLGSLLCGLSSTTAQLLTSRVIQGLGSAALFTTAFAVVADLFAPRERGRYAGLFGAVFGLSSVVGPLVGGFITDTFGWHWCFLINLPVGAVAVAVIVLRMPPLVQEGQSKKIDVVGALLFALAVVPLLSALSFAKLELRPGDVGVLWHHPIILGALVAALVSGVAFIVVERRVEQPIIDLRLWRERAFTTGVVASFVVGMAFLGAIVFLPLFMVAVVGASATAAGLTTTPLTFGIVAGNIVSGQLSSKTGRYKSIILWSLVLLTIAFAVMAFTLSPDVSPLTMSLRMVLIGLGLGPSIPLFNVHISNSVAPHQIGAATSTATLSRSLGSTVGIAIFGNIFGMGLAHDIEKEMAQANIPPALVAQFEARQAPVGASGESEIPRRTFDVVAVKQRIREGFAEQRAHLPPGAASALMAKETEAIAAVDRVDAAIKLAFTSATARIYAVAILFALAGLLASASIPERPLQSHRGAGPPALE
jgi:EmrB/QacA subfamily drug resistance transporter